MGQESHPKIKRKPLVWIGLACVILFAGLWFFPWQRPAANGPVVYGGKLRFSSAERFQALFPLSSNTLDYHRVQQLVFEPVLLASDNSKGWAYNLAKRIKVSADKRQITIELKKHIYFSDDACFRFESQELTAEDLAFTLSYACSSQPFNQQSHLLIGLIQGAQAYYEANGSPFDKTVSGIKVKDKHTLSIQLTGPYNHFLPLLSNNSLGVLSKKAGDYYKDNLVDHPVGTGAFYLETKEEGRLLFKRNKAYWKKDKYGNQLPYLEEVEVFTGVSSSIEHRLFSENRSDLLFDLPVNQLPAAFGTLQDAQKGKNPLHEVYIKPSSKIHYLYFNAMRGPLQNKLVRKAISLAIDQRSICTNDLNGEGSPMIGQFIPERKGYRNELLIAAQNELKLRSQADKNTEAKALLVKAGYSARRKFPVLSLAVGGPNNSVAAAWCRAVQQMLLQNLGIRLRLIYSSSVSDNLYNTKIDIWRGGWVGDYPGEESYLRLFYSAAQKPLFYKNKAIDQFYLASIFADDQSKMHKFSQKICENEIINDYALVPIYTEDFFVLNKLSVRGFELSESGIVDFSKIYLKAI